MNAGADKPNGRGWVRLKLTFTDRVMDDKGVPPIPFKLAAALARFADAETGIVDRSQAFLADVVNVKLRTLQLAIDLLVERGHVVVLKPKGRRSGNRYAPTLRPKDSLDTVHMHDDAHETGSVDAHDGAHETAVHAHETASSCAPRCAPSPVYSSVIDHPVADAPASPPRTTTTGVAEDGLVDQIRTAIESAGGRLTKGRHVLQPIRDLIVGGVAVDFVLSVVADRASKLRGPLGNLDAPWLLDAIRDRAAADGYGTGRPAEPSIAAKPVDVGPTRRTPAGHDWSETTIVRTVAAGFAGGPWPTDWGARPGRFGCLVDPDLVERGQRAVLEAVSAFEVDGSWPPGFGPRPDSLASPLGLEFGIERVALRHGAGGVTALALDAHLRLLARDFGDDEFARCYRAPPSPLDSEDCTLPLQWQMKALEYRNAVD